MVRPDRGPTPEGNGAPSPRRTEGIPTNESVIYTVGHSTRTARDLLALLRAHRIERVVDVRSIPRSRHNPQFNRERFPKTLHGAGIHYRHLAGLGGLRHPRPDSPNTAWRNPSFQGFADYMQTSEFAESLTECVRLARSERVALMCAEAVPWRCHRSLLADALLVRGFDVREIQSTVRSAPLRLTPWAKVRGSAITYPGPAALRTPSQAESAGRRRRPTDGRTSGRSADRNGRRTRRKMVKRGSAFRHHRGVNT